MKSKFFIQSALVLACSFPVLGFAQISFGVKGGSTWSSINGSNAFENNTIRAATYGGFINFGGLVFSVQPEVLITQKGGSGKNSVLSIPSFRFY
jgi:hypothetical protein